MRVGEDLGRYRVTDVIGRGGMSVVYAGQHVGMGHDVAIKVLNPEHLRNPVMKRRFLNEARALVSIRHPGIVELLDAGCTPEGRAYLVMELLHGESLSERLEQGPMPLAEAIAFGRQLASALTAAHLQGIVHRDLKPANIVIVRDPEAALGERVKILDFGIAKRIDTHTPAPITASGIIIGTPEYMSPEQCRGDEEIDARSDIYCLGLVLYHMVTGMYPFGSGGDTQEILARHLYGFSEAPSHIDDTVPAALSQVITRCMAKLPANRYATAREVHAELTAVEQLVCVHEIFDPADVDIIDEATEPLQSLTARALSEPMRLTQETRVKRRTGPELVLAGVRVVMFAALVLSAAAGGAIALRALRNPAPAAAAHRVTSPRSVKAATAALAEEPPAPTAATTTIVRKARPAKPAPAPVEVMVDEPPPVERKAQAPARRERPRAEPRRVQPVERRAPPKKHASPPPAEVPLADPPHRKTYEDVDTPVVY